MTELVRISQVQFTAATEVDQAGGLLGWLSCVVNDLLVLNGLALRRTAVDARVVVSFPARRDGVGKQWFHVRPVDDRARVLLEREILRALGLSGVKVREGAP